MSKKQTRCRRGHAMTPSNTRVNVRANGQEQRQCRICLKITEGARSPRVKAEKGCDKRTSAILALCAAKEIAPHWRKAEIEAELRCYREAGRG